MYFIDLEDEYNLIQNQKEQPLVQIALQGKSPVMLHKGHRKLIDYAKKQNPDAKIVVRTYHDIDLAFLYLQVYLFHTILVFLQ